jgi:hypothetical protein
MPARAPSLPDRRSLPCFHDTPTVSSASAENFHETVKFACMPPIMGNNYETSGHIRRFMCRAAPRLMSFVESWTMVISAIPDLQQELEQHVSLRTGRRVRNLAVELEPERVVLRGQATTYHVKQLAQHGIRDLLPHVRLENVIVVVSPD